MAVETPIVALESLARLLHMREAPGSNLGPEAGYPDRLFVIFLGSLKQILGLYL